MTDLFYTGGPLFMGILTLILIAAIALSVGSFLQIQNNKTTRSGLVKELGIFALVTGIFGQFLGLYSAFAVIEVSGTVSPELLMSGLKVSSITTLYGLLICIIAYLLYFGLMAFHSKKENLQTEAG